MALTRLDCDLFRGHQAVADASSYIAMNPVGKPAQLVFAGSTAVKLGLGSQVAYRLALDHFVEGVRAHYASPRQETQRVSDDEMVVKVLEDAFRTANSSVYNFGHRLAAGGRMAASLLGFVIDERKFAAARVGLGSVYLFRDRQLFPFFSSEGIERGVVGDLDEFPSDLHIQRQAFVGSNSIIDVEVASVELAPGDVVCAFSRPLSSLNETLLFQHLEMLLEEGFPENQQQSLAEHLCVEVFTEPDTLSFACVACVGPDVIYCSKVVG